MAKRIGKYKVSNKESTLSIADGGTVDGALTFTSATVKLSGLASVSESNASSQYMLFTTASDHLGHKLAVESASFDVVCIRTN